MPLVLSQDPVLAVEEAEEAGAVAVEIVMGLVDDGGYPADRLAAAPGHEQLALAVAPERVARLEQVAHVLLQFAHPVRVVLEEAVGVVYEDAEVLFGDFPNFQ